MYQDEESLDITLSWERMFHTRRGKDFDILTFICPECGIEWVREYWKDDVVLSQLGEPVDVTRGRKCLDCRSTDFYHEIMDDDTHKLLTKKDDDDI